MRLITMPTAGSLHGSFSPSHTLSPWSPDHEFIHPMKAMNYNSKHLNMVKEFSPSPINVTDSGVSVPTTMTSLVTHEYPANGVGSPYFRRNTMGTRTPMDVLPAISTSSPKESANSTVSSSPHPTDASDTG